MRRLLFFALAFCPLTGLAAAAPLTEARYKQDMAFYEKTAKKGNLGANDRIFILERLRSKYKSADFDLSALYAEIDKWYGARMSEKKSPPPKKTAPPSRGQLNKIEVTESPDFSRLILSVPGKSEYKDEWIRDPKGLSPPVVLVYLYDTRANLPGASRDLAFKEGVIRRVQAQSLPGKRPALKIHVALRDDRPYEIYEEDGQIILAFDKGAGEAEDSEALSPEEEEALTAVSPSTPTTIPVTIAGAVKRPGPLRVKEGTRLIEAVGLAGGFEQNAQTEALKLVRWEGGKRVSSDYNASAGPGKPAPQEVVLKSGDVVMVPERETFKDKVMSSKAVPWATFFVSMGLVLALLI